MLNMMSPAPSLGPQSSRARLPRVHSKGRWGFFFSIIKEGFLGG